VKIRRLIRKSKGVITQYKGFKMQSKVVRYNLKTKVLKRKTKAF
jgi:hypothetical protein